MKHAYLDEYSYLNSFVNLLDPRIKVISFIGLILCIVFTGRSAYLTFNLYAILIAVLILLSGIPPIFIFRRSLVIIPFVIMVSFFILFKKDNGLLIFRNIVIKSYLCILCMILLVSSTKFADLLKSLEQLKVPEIIVMIISFMYRYIFVVQDEIEHMGRARQSRSCGRRPWYNTTALANTLGVLFIKSYERAEAVYLAMCARGFSGSVKTIDEFQIKAADLAFLFTIVLLLIGIRILTH